MFPLIVSFSPCSEITFKSPDPFETPDFCLKKKNTIRKFRVSVPKFNPSTSSGICLLGSGFICKFASKFFPLVSSLALVFC